MIPHTCFSEIKGLRVLKLFQCHFGADIWRNQSSLIIRIHSIYQMVLQNQYYAAKYEI